MRSRRRAWRRSTATSARFRAATRSPRSGTPAGALSAKQSGKEATLNNIRDDRIPGRRRILWFASAGLAAAALAVAGCGGDDADDGSGESGGGTESVQLTLPFQDSIVWAGYEVARERFYPDLGLDVSTQNADGDSYVSQQLSAGKIPYAVGGSAETIVANSQGHEQTSVADLNADIFSIVATPESGITAVEDLEGGSLGITDLGGGEMPLVNAILKEYGLEDGENIELKVVGPGGPAAARAIQDGEIDAYAGATNDFAGLQAAGLELNSILDEKYTGLPSNVLLVNPDTLEDDAELETVLKLAAGWFDGVLYAKKNPDEALDIICGYVPEECKDMDVAKQFFDNTLDGAVPAAEAAGEQDLEKYGIVQDAIVGEDIEGAQPVDLESVFTNEYIDRIREYMTMDG
ncbi:MAG: hypothetical protein GEU88_09075 [Solirubrobacterales bacterium]|nr:hypothetical protein [Solirubrobacterales bacterium]